MARVVHKPVREALDFSVIFPNADAITHLVGVILLGPNDEWAVQPPRACHRLSQSRAAARQKAPV